MRQTLVGLALGVAFGLAPLRSAAAVDLPLQAADCSVTDGRSGYTAQLCLGPSGGPLSGSVTVAAEVTLSAAKTGLRLVTFCLDGSVDGPTPCTNGGPGYLLTDAIPQARPARTVTDWTFQLPTDKWVDGDHTLLAVATLLDGTTTEPATTRVSFVNGNLAQPVNGASPVLVRPTSPAPGAPLVVAATSGLRGTDPASPDKMHQIASWSPGLVIFLGDVGVKGSYTEFVNWYSPAFGPFRSITAPVLGDREYASRSDPATSPDVPTSHVAYFDYWNNLPDYYSFDAGGWHFIALNANGSQMTGPNWFRQLEWLDSELANHATDCTIAFWHQPAFTIRASPASSYALKLWALVAGHATLVLNGHEQTYQRWTAMDAQGDASASGTVEVVAPAGADSARGAPAPTASPQPRALAWSSSPAVVRLSLTPGEASVQAISTDGATLDSATIPCLPSQPVAVATVPPPPDSRPTASGPTGADRPTPVDPVGLSLSLAIVFVLALGSWRLGSLSGPTLGVALAASSTFLVGGAALNVPLFPFTNLLVLSFALTAGIVVARNLAPRSGAMLLLLAAATLLDRIPLWREATGAAVDTGAAAGAGPGAGAYYSAFTFPASWAQLSLGVFFLLLVGSVGAHARWRSLPPTAAVLPGVTAVTLAAAVGLVVPWPDALLPSLLLGWLGTEATLGFGWRSRAKAGKAEESPTARMAGP